MRRHFATVNLSLLLTALIVAVGGAAPAATALPPTIVVDVLVVGGSPGGVAAAIGAARGGATVVLAEDDQQLGGVITSAWLTTFDMNMSPDGQHLTRGVFLEAYRQLGVSFDPDEAARVFGRAVVHEPGIRTMLDSSLVRLILEGDRVAGAEFYDRRWRRLTEVRARQVIDATDDGDVAAAAGAPWVLGRAGYRANERLLQAATLIFRVGAVDWQTVSADVARQADAAGLHAWGVNGRAAWGYAAEAARYEPADPSVLLYPLNLARQRDGSVLVNALNITGTNGLDPASIAAAMSKATAEMPRVVAFLRRTIPGFERAHLLDHAPSLYVRETRHVAGLYTLGVEDILAQQVFEDRIAVASYPIDIHAYYAGWTNPYRPEARVYTIPFRAIVPRAVDNLLLATRAFSATSEAHGSARVVPTIMALGQAAGVTAAFCARRGCAPRDVADDWALLHAVQGALIGQGAYLGGRP
jgi:hypothetical protein